MNFLLCLSKPIRLW